ncbi:trimeric intracellular cation channel type A-like [Branchiostoma floridae x Branchiostoma belcheri]
MEVVQDVAEVFATLPMFPVFNACHYTLMILTTRYDTGSLALSRSNPLANWVASMIACFGGYILADLLLGHSVLSFLAHPEDVVLATAIWYLLFYCPKDLFYKIISILPLKLVITALKETARVRKLVAGIGAAAKVYPHSLLAQVIVGVAKACGNEFLLNFEQAVRGVWKPDINAILKPSFSIKACVVGAVLIILGRTDVLMGISQEMVVLAVSLWLISVAVSMKAFHADDPFKPVENLFSPFIFGSADSLPADAHHHHPPAPEPATPTPKPAGGRRRGKAAKAD